MSAKDESPLAHHFANLAQQHLASNLGMWIFLATELMFFGGLFTAYAVYRWWYPDAFRAGSHELSVWFGGGNTLVLLTSSLTMALGVWAAQTDRRRLLVQMLLATAGLGALFLVVKGFEYRQDYVEGLVPGIHFDDQHFQAPRDGVVLPEEARTPWGDVLTPGAVPRSRNQPNPFVRANDHARHVELFFVFYYVMTLIHAIHLIIGIVIMLVLAHKAQRGRYGPLHYAPVEVGGLYWHFVDVIWIFLLPLLYLIG